MLSPPAETYIHLSSRPFPSPSPPPLPFSISPFPLSAAFPICFKVLQIGVAISYSRRSYMLEARGGYTL